MTLATRRERVVLELQDEFSGPMARAAASTVIFKKALNDLDGSAVKVDRALNETSTSGAGVSREFDRGRASIDQFSGRLGLAARAIAAFAPAAAPIGAVVVPALTSMSAALGATVLAGGTAVLAFQGVGDALEALNAAQLEPTAANLEKAKQAFDDISPSARQFVLDLDAAAPALAKLKMSAGSELFPGLSVALEGALTQLPRARALLESVGGAIGNLGEMTGQSLASGRWNEFLDFLTRTAPPAIEALGRTVGNLAGGLASLWMAFDPLNTSVIAMLVRGSEAFEKWANALGDTDGFREFVEYVRTSGPQVGSALASIGNAVLQVAEAIAPLGGPSLRIIKSLADAIATIADSPVGTPLLGLVAAMSALSLATRGYSAIRSAAFGAPAVANIRSTTAALREATTAQERFSAVGAGVRGLGKQTALLGGLALASSGVADSFNLSNTASLALAGSLAGPWGAAVGGAIGLVKDFGANTDELTAQIEGTRDALAAVAPDGSGLAAASEAVRGQLMVINELQRQRQDAGLGRDAGMDRQAADLAKQLATVRGETDVTKLSTRQLAQAMSTSAAAAFQEAGGIQASIDAMREKRSQALAALNAELGYKGAILDARDALKENGRTVDENTRAGQANLRSLYQLGDAWNQQSDAQKNASGGLKAAKANFVATAGAMGMSEEAARRLAKRIFEIPEKRAIDVSLRDEATAKLRSIKAQVDGLKGKTLYINTVFQGRRPTAPGGLGAVSNAEGGTIDGPRHPYGDKVLSWLAPGEEVISNRHGQADRFRADRAAGRIPGYADGGTAGEDKAPTEAQRRVAAKRAAARALARTRANRALGGLDVDLGVNADGASDALAKFADDVDHVRDLFKDAGFKWTKSLDSQTDAVRKSARQYDALNSALASARGDKASFASTVGSSLGRDVFGNGLAGFDASVAANTADYSAAQAALSAALGKGLTATDNPLTPVVENALFAALASSGDLNAITQFGGLDAAGIAERERQYAALQSAQSGFGNLAASAKYDASIASYAAELKRNTAAIERLEKRLPNAVRDGAREGSHSGSESGTRSGNQDRDTKTTQNTQTTGRGGGRRNGGR